MRVKLKIHLSIDHSSIKKIDTVLPLFFEYDRKGWIVESVRDFVEKDKKKPIETDEIKSHQTHFDLAKRMEITLDPKTIYGLNSMVERLKKQKKGISRNLLINEAVRRKLENNGLFLISKIRSLDIGSKNEEVTVIARLDPNFIIKIKKSVESTRQRKQEYFIHNWISEAITELLNEEVTRLYTVDPNTKNSVSISKCQCVYLKITRTMLSEVDSLVQKIKKTTPSFSRNKLFYDAVRKKIEKEDFSK